MAFVPTPSTSKINPIVGSVGTTTNLSFTQWPVSVVPMPNVATGGGGSSAKPVGYPIT